MARTRRKVAYRKRHQNKLSMFLVSLVVMMMVVVVAVRSAGIRQKIEVKEAYAQQLDNQIEDEQKRTEEIEEFGKRVHTKGYYEEVAREKMGLVREGEILFKEE
ncbi:MAG: septum formation initiator family protein [Acetatifactor sp.]